MPWAIFDKKHEQSGEWSGFLEHGVRLEGKLEAPGTFRIDARFKGSLLSEEMLIVAENAVVEGEISGNAVIISGRFDGTIQARGKVEIQARAVVTGDIQTPCLIIDPGAMFDGRCHIVTGKDASQILIIPVRSAGSHA